MAVLTSHTERPQVADGANSGAWQSLPFFGGSSRTGQWFLGQDRWPAYLAVEFGRGSSFSIGEGKGRIFRMNTKTLPGMWRGG